MGDLSDVGMPDILFEVNSQVSVGGETVFLPRPEGFEGYQLALEGTRRTPRFSQSGLFAAGYLVGKRGKVEPFADPGQGVQELLFYIFPKNPRWGDGKPLEVSKETYQQWRETGGQKNRARQIANLVLGAVVDALGGDLEESRISGVAGGDNEGFPFFAGKLDIVDGSMQCRQMYFASAISLVGGTWGLVTVVSIESGDVADKAIRLAKSLYFLNKDHRGVGKRKKESSGPFVGTANF